MTEQEYHSLRDLMHELKTALEAHIEQENEFRPKLLELVTILERSKGAIIFFKVMLYIGAPIVIFITWVKDHVKL